MNFPSAARVNKQRFPVSRLSLAQMAARSRGNGADRAARNTGGSVESVSENVHRPAGVPGELFHFALKRRCGPGRRPYGSFGHEGGNAGQGLDAREDIRMRVRLARRTRNGKPDAQYNQSCRGGRPEAGGNMPKPVRGFPPAPRDRRHDVAVQMRGRFACRPFGTQAIFDSRPGFRRTVRAFRSPPPGSGSAVFHVPAFPRSRSDGGQAAARRRRPRCRRTFTLTRVLPMTAAMAATEKSSRICSHNAVN